jgi:hypothetical protein
MNPTLPATPATAPGATPAQLAQAVATSMAEIAGNIGGTLAGAMAAPLTAAAAHVTAIETLRADAEPPRDEPATDVARSAEPADDGVHTEPPPHDPG